MSQNQKMSTDRFFVAEMTHVEHHNAQYTHQHHYVPHFFDTTLFLMFVVGEFGRRWTKNDVSLNYNNAWRLDNMVLHENRLVWMLSMARLSELRWAEAADFSYGGVCIG